MSESTTRPNPGGLPSFLSRVDPARLDETHRLIAIFREVSGYEPVVWGNAMLGFGRYVYTYESGRTGESLATGFAPRKAEFSIYILPGLSQFADILADIGTHRVGKSCLYLKRLDWVNETALRRLIRAGLDDLAQRWPVLPA